MIVLTVTAEVEIPQVPNFLKTPAGMMLPLDALSEEGLREVAKHWTEALIERQAEMREKAKNPGPERHTFVGGLEVNCTICGKPQPAEVHNK